MSTQRATSHPMRLKLHRGLCDGESPDHWRSPSVSRPSAGSQSCGGFSGMSRLSLRGCGQKSVASWLVPSCRREGKSSPITAGAAELTSSRRHGASSTSTYIWTRARHETMGVMSQVEARRPSAPETRHTLQPVIVSTLCALSLAKPLQEQQHDLPPLTTMKPFPILLYAITPLARAAVFAPSPVKEADSLITPPPPYPAGDALRAGGLPGMSPLRRGPLYDEDDAANPVEKRQQVLQTTCALIGGNPS